MNEKNFILERNNGSIKNDTIWERYFDKTHPKNNQTVERITWIIEQIRGTKLLDIGCSNGLGMFLASKNKKIEILCGIDVNKKAIDKAKKNNENIKKSIFLECGLAEKLPFKNSFFDCIIMGEVLEHVMSETDVISEAYRVLKMGGIIIITVPNGGHISKDHLRIFTKETINKLILNAGFNLLKIITLYDWILLKATK